jgi:hypothetical protein
MVVHACNLSTWEAEVGDLEFDYSLGYIVRFCLKIQNHKTKKTFINGIIQFSCSIILTENPSELLHVLVVHSFLLLSTIP